MARIALHLADPADLALLKTTGWRLAPGLVPGEPHQSLTAEWRASPARRADYDDSWGEKDADIQERRALGCTFAWYRIRVTIPSAVQGEDIAGRRIWVETNVDNYGEVSVDGKMDQVNGVITGNNVGKRIQIEDSAVPGTAHGMAVFVCNAPLAEPVGTIFMRYATLAMA
jgi:hypothetical protein